MIFKNFSQISKIVFFATLVLQFSAVKSQVIEFSTIYSENKITEFTNQKLILVDFWATWCAPCVFASQQLEIFQEANKSKVFIISETDESESKISKFLLKNPSNLMVVTDIKKINIDKYNVTSRPYAVLLDLDGKLLWSGHPSDLSQKKLDNFYNISNKIKSKKFSEIVLSNSLPINKDVVPYNFEIKSSDILIHSFEINEQGIVFSGDIKNLIAKIANTNIFAVDIADDKNQFVSFRCSKADWEQKDELLTSISNHFNFVIIKTENDVLAKNIVVSNENLHWKTEEIIWEDAIEKYLVGDTKITANDCTLSELALILSDVKKDNYVYIGNNQSKYDWDFQFKFDDLMAEDLQSTFGVKIVEEKIKQRILKIEFQ